MSKIENEVNTAEKTARKLSLFYKRIFCIYCGKGMKRKKERGSVKYCCSQYDNFGNCRRNIIEEDYLIELLHKRLNTEITREVVEEFVESVVVEDRNLVEIFIKEQESILMSKTHLRF